MSEPNSPDPYLGVNKIDPSEWLNIPRPVIDALIILKSLAIEHANTIKEVTSSFFVQQANVSEEIRRVGKDLSYIKTTFTKYQEDSMIMMETQNSNLNQELNKFKSNLLVDLDYKQKNNDSKIAYLEEQIFHTRKFTSSLPTMLEIGNRINDAVNDMRVKVKTEIKESMLMPEVRGLSSDIKESSQKLKTEILETEDRIDNKLKKTNQNIQDINSFIEDLQKKLNSLQVKFTELSDFTDNNESKIQELNVMIDDNDKNYKAAFKKVDAKFNIVHASISDTQSDLSSTKDKFLDVENEFNSVKDLIYQVEANLTENIKSLIEESKKFKGPERTSTRKDSDASPLLRKNSELKPAKISESIIQDFKNEINDMKTALMNSSTAAEEKLKAEIEKNMNDFSELVKKMKKENDESFKEIQSKLTWLPVNVTDMTNMNAHEARLFTLEARLRSEENSRIKSVNFLSKLIENIRLSRELGYIDKFPKSRDTPEGLYTAEILRKFGENDKKNIDVKEMYLHLLEGTFHDEHPESRKHHRTPKSRDYAMEPLREARTNSVMGRRVMRNL